MKKTAAILLALLMLLLCACKGSDAPGTEASDPTAAPEATLEPTLEPSEEPSSEPGYSPEFEVMRLANLEYGTDYVSLYDEFGSEVTIADVTEDGEGFAHIVRGGEDYLLGLDFLSKAMVYNTEPAGEFLTPDEVSAEWWRYYILRWNRLMPEIPFYCSEYHTVYNTKITGVEQTPTNPYFPQEMAVLYWGSEKEDNSIAIGSEEEFDGNFRCGEFNLEWPVNGLDKGGVITLVNGLELVSKTRWGGLCWNDTVVKTHEQTVTADGSLCFSIELWDDLYFSDGSPVTAKDYLAKLMVVHTPVFRKAFPDSDPKFTQIVPDDDPFVTFDGADGTCPLSCLHLNGERSFSITLPPEFTGNYFALSQLNIPAQPHEIWLCGADIRDDGEGCYITPDFYEKKNGNFTAVKELRKLKSDMSEDPEVPGPWSGPYKFVSAETVEHGQVTGGVMKLTLERNEYFKGNYEGVKPSIDRIVFGQIIYASWAEDMLKGDLDVMPRITGQLELENAQNVLIEGSDGAFAVTSYRRAGYSAFVMRDDLGPAQFASVRRAFSYCIDRDEADKLLFSGSGPIDAPVSEDLWLYRLAQARGLELEHYDIDVEKAIAELEADGWIYNEKGEPYESGVRYKRIPGDVIDETDKTYASIDGEYSTVKVGEDYYMPLALNWFIAINSGLQGFESILVNNENEDLTRAGFYYSSLLGEFRQLLDEFAQQPLYGFYDGTPRFNAFMLSRSFQSNAYDRSLMHSIEPEAFNDYSDNYLRDWADVVMLNK